MNQLSICGCTNHKRLSSPLKCPMQRKCFGGHEKNVLVMASKWLKILQKARYPGYILLLSWLLGSLQELHLVRIILTPSPETKLHGHIQSSNATCSCNLNSITSAQPLMIWKNFRTHNFPEIIVRLTYIAVSKCMPSQQL